MPTARHLRRLAQEGAAITREMDMHLQEVEEAGLLEGQTPPPDLNLQAPPLPNDDEENFGEGNPGGQNHIRQLASPTPEPEDAMDEDGAELPGVDPDSDDEFIGNRPQAGALPEPEGREESPEEPDPDVPVQVQVDVGVEQPEDGDEDFLRHLREDLERRIHAAGGHYLAMSNIALFS